jgi:hypothetical protein
MLKLDVFPNSGNLKLHPLDHLIPLLYHLHHLSQPLHHLMLNYQIIRPYHHLLQLQHTLLHQLDLVVRAVVEEVVGGDWGWIHRMRWIQRLLLLLLNYNWKIKRRGRGKMRGGGNYRLMRNLLGRNSRVRRKNGRLINMSRNRGYGSRGSRLSGMSLEL